jgi:hypothetical protein
VTAAETVFAPTEIPIFPAPEPAVLIAQPLTLTEEVAEIVFAGIWKDLQEPELEVADSELK